MLVASLPASLWAAAPIAEDDPDPGCGNLERFGGSWPIPEDYGQSEFILGMQCAITGNDSDPEGDPLTYSLVTGPAHGDLVLDANGVVAYTPDPDHSTNPGDDLGGSWVSDSYVYQVTDGTATDTATHRFWIAPANDPPTFTPATPFPGIWAWEDNGPYSLPWALDLSPGPGPSEADQSVTFDVTTTIVEGGPGLFTDPPAVSHDGTLTFTSAPNRSGRASVRVVARDDGGLPNHLGGPNPSDDTAEPVTFGISIFAANDPPIAGDDPPAGCGNMAQFGGSWPIPEDSAQVGFIPGTPCSITANDSDADGDPLTWSIVTPPEHGDLIVDANGVVGYSADPGYSTLPGSHPDGTWVSDSYVYQVSDGAETDTATHRFWIAPINDAPTFTRDPAYESGVWAWEDSGEYSAQWATDISAGPGPSEAGQTVTFETSTWIAAGDLDLFAVPPAISSDGILTFTAAPNRVGRANMWVYAKDDGGLESYLGVLNTADDSSDGVLVPIYVYEVDDPPVAVDDPGTQCLETRGGSFVVPEDGGWSFFIFCGLLDNDTDIDTPRGDLTWELVTPPAHATVTKLGRYDMTFVPDADYATRPGDVVGGTWVSDSFTYRAVGGGHESEPATARFWIAEINDAPSFAPGGNVAIAEDSAPYSAAWASAISPGPPSESGQSVAFEVTGVEVSGGGTLFATPPAVDADGMLTFATAPGASGTAQVTVQATDDGGLDDHGIETLTQPPDDTSDAVTFQITVSGDNDAPVADDDARTVAEDQAVTALSVLGNDSDPDGDPLTITAVSNPPKGTASIVGNDVLYVPDANANGADAFNYTVSDGRGGTDTATEAMTITPINDAPAANNDVRTVAEDQAVTALSVRGNDSDVEGDPLTITGVSNPPKGTASIIGNDVRYVPDANAFGSDALTYTLSDGHGGTDTAAVTMTITPINDAPLANNDAATIMDGPAVAIPVLANDVDVDADSIRISTVTRGSRGKVAITGGGSGLTYDPNPLATGNDVFSYTIHDGHGRTDMATVSVTVSRDAVAPTITTTTESLPGQTIGTSTVRTRVTWAGSDLGSGINNYHVQVSVNGGAYGTITIPTATTTSVERTLAIGSTYRFRVRAKDRAGNVSSFKAWPALTPARLQESTTNATYTGSWSVATHPSASGGASRHTRYASRKVVVRFLGRDVAWIATRTPSGGRADVRIDGVLVGTAQLVRASTAYRQLVLGRHLSTLAWHTIEIRPLGDGRVDLDAIIVLR